MQFRARYFTFTTGKCLENNSTLVQTPNFLWAEPNSNKADPNTTTTTTLSTLAQKSKFLNNYQIFFKEFDENENIYWLGCK